MAVRSQLKDSPAIGIKRIPPTEGSKTQKRKANLERHKASTRGMK